MNSAELVAVELRKIPGSVVRTYFSKGHGYYAIAWDYQCPCGETSQYDLRINDGCTRSAASWLEYAKEAMRRHVRSEGNEPSF